jgi:hypothetical protein
MGHNKTWRGHSLPCVKNTHTTNYYFTMCLITSTQRTIGQTAKFDFLVLFRITSLVK